MCVSDRQQTTGSPRPVRPAQSSVTWPLPEGRSAADRLTPAPSPARCPSRDRGRVGEGRMIGFVVYAWISTIPLVSFPWAFLLFATSQDMSVTPSSMTWKVQRSSRARAGVWYRRQAIDGHFQPPRLRSCVSSVWYRWCQHLFRPRTGDKGIHQKELDGLLFWLYFRVSRIGAAH